MRSRRHAALVVAPLVALTMSCGPAARVGTVGHVAGPGSVTINGKIISLAGLTSIESALVKTGTTVPSGALLSIVTHSKIGDSPTAGQVLLNGVVSVVSAPLANGDVLQTVASPDAVETTRNAVESLAATINAGLYVGGQPGSARVVEGAVSGEVVSRQVLTAPVLGHLPSPGAVALTFDDGPNPIYTPLILQQLALHHVHATFCIIGRQAQQYPALIKAIVAGGHTLCNHTWDHDEGLPDRTPAQILSEMNRAQVAITQASGGIVPKLFRAPGGAFSARVDSLAGSLGMTPLNWTVDPRDWARPGTNAIIAVTLAQLRPGGVVLLHDGGGKRDETVAALTSLLVTLPQLHYTYAIPQP